MKTHNIEEEFPCDKYPPKRITVSGQHSADAQEYAWRAMKAAWLDCRMPGVCVLEEDIAKRKQVLTTFSEYLRAQGCRVIVAGQIATDSLEQPTTDEQTAINEALRCLEWPITFERPDLFEALSRAPSDEHPLVLVVPNLELPIGELDQYLRQCRSKYFTYAVVGAEVDSEAPIPGAYTVFDPHIFPIHIDGNWNVYEESD